MAWTPHTTTGQAHTPEIAQINQEAFSLQAFSFVRSLLQHSAVKGESALTTEASEEQEFGNRWRLFSASLVKTLFATVSANVMKAHGILKMMAVYVLTATEAFQNEHVGITS